MPAQALREFVRKAGVARANCIVDIQMYEHTVRDHLNKTAPRRMAVLRPLKIVIENYPEGKTGELDAVNHPEDPAAGSRLKPRSGSGYSMPRKRPLRGAQACRESA